MTSIRETTSVKNYSTFEGTSPIQPSLQRKLRHALTKIFHDIWITLASMFSSVKLTTREARTAREACIMHQEELEQIDPNLASIIKKIEGKRDIGPAAVTAYVEFLKTKVTRFEMNGAFMLPAMGQSFHFESKEELQNRGIHFLAVPVVVSGTARDHIVTFFIDLNKNEIEFYDPKGLTILDRKGERLLSNPEMDLLALYKRLQSTYGTTKVIENTAKHQYDSHNCGVYVCDYYVRRLHRQTPAHIAETGEDYSTANNFLREKMIGAICMNALQELQNQKKHQWKV